MKTALIGGTGFVGSYIIDELIKHNMTPRLLVRHGAQSKLLQQEKCELVFGEVDDKTAIQETVQGCSAVIYNIGIIRIPREWNYIRKSSLPGGKTMHRFSCKFKN